MGRGGPGGPGAQGGPNGPNRGPDRGPNANFAPGPRSDFNGPGPRGMRDGSGPPSNERFDRLRERFSSLPPEAQDRIIQRFEEMLARLENQRGPRPAPDMNDVDVPPPPPLPPAPMNNPDDRL